MLVVGKVGGKMRLKYELPKYRRPYIIHYDGNSCKQGIIWAKTQAFLHSNCAYSATLFMMPKCVDIHCDRLFQTLSFKVYKGNYGHTHSPMLK